MRSIILQKPYDLQLHDRPEPSVGDGEALVQIQHIGICGTDLHAFRGNQPFFTYPRILGHELAAEILKIGPNPAGLRPGDLCVILPYLPCGCCIACRQGKTNCCTRLQVIGVHIDGGMQERFSLPSTNLVKADGLTSEQMALVENQSIGAHAVRRAQLVPGETVLVIGAGPIGIGVIQFAHLSGASIIVADIDEARLAFCQQWLTVKHILNAGEDISVGTPLVGGLSALTNGDLPSVVFDATGSARSMINAFHYVAHGGRLVFVGLVQADIAFPDPDFHRRELTLLSSRNATLEDFERVITAMREGQIVTEPLITHRLPFDQVPVAFGGWLEPGSGFIKALVEL